MSLTKIYQDAVNLPEKDKGQEITEKEPVSLSWLAHPGTKEYFDKVKQEIDALIQESVNMAVNYPQTKNHEGIIAKLVRIDCLKKQIQYARR